MLGLGEPASDPTGGHGIALATACGAWVVPYLESGRPPKALAWYRSSPPWLPTEALRWLGFRSVMSVLKLLEATGSVMTRRPMLPRCSYKKRKRSMTHESFGDCASVLAISTGNVFPTPIVHRTSQPVASTSTSPPPRARPRPKPHGLALPARGTVMIVGDSGMFSATPAFSAALDAAGWRVVETAYPGIGLSRLSKWLDD